MPPQPDGRLRIAIDGPAGAGKSTVAKEVARRLGISYLDTGAMYRAAAWLALRFGIGLTDADSIANLLEQKPPRFTCDHDGNMEVYWSGERITEVLRTPEVSEAVSALSAHPRIRQILTSWQSEYGDEHDVVMDGRDIGTVVLPNAEVKVFLTADLKERAARRANELTRKGLTTSTEEMAMAIEKRDAHDTGRTIAPLRQAPDAHRIDSTGRSVEEVVDSILSLVPWEYSS